MVTVRFHDDPAAFLAVAQHYLRAAPVAASVVAGQAVALTTEAATGPLPSTTWPRWFASVHGDDGAVVGAAMKAKPLDPHWAYVMHMPERGAQLLAQALFARGEALRAISGTLPAAQLVAAELASLSGQRVTTTMRLTLHELGRLRMPTVPPGRLRLATDRDLELVLDWFARFHDEADQQAGRVGGHGPTLPADQILSRIDQAGVWLWENENGLIVHLTGIRPPAYGVARIGPVYTPTAHRGRGYAAATVAQVSQQVQSAGQRVCLFTDQANPVSNALYARLGFEAGAETVDLELRP